MVLLRITATTALSQLRQVGADLRRMLADTGPLASGPRLQLHLDAFDAFCAGNAPLPIEVWIDDGTAAQDAVAWLLGDAFAATPGGTDPSRIESTVGARAVTLSLATSERPSVFPPGAVAPSLLVWLRAHATEHPEPALDDYGVVVEVEGLPATPHAPCGDDRIRIDRARPSGVLPEIFPAATQMIDLLFADAAVRALERLAKLAGLAVDQEARAIRGRRALAQQRAQSVPARSSGAAGDLVTRLRADVQRVTGEFSRRIDTRYARDLVAPGSPFSVELEAFLERVELVVEPHARALTTRLAPEIQEEWAALLRQTLTRHCEADLADLRDTMRDLTSRIEAAVEEPTRVPILVQFQPMDEDRLVHALSLALAPQRTYQGEIQKHGPMEYVMMARRFQTLVMMLLTLLIPGLAVLREKSQYAVPSAIVLLSAGALQVTQSVKRERAEALKKERARARELMQSESRRVIGDLQRAWPSMVSQHLSEQAAAVLGQVESSTREYAARAGAKDAEEQQRLQRQIQGFESAERALAMQQRPRDSLAQSIAQARGELTQLIGAAVRTVSA